MMPLDNSITYDSPMELNATPVTATSVPSQETHPLIGATLVVISAVFIGISYVAQRKGNLVNNEQQQEQNRETTPADDSGHDNAGFGGVRDEPLDADDKTVVIRTASSTNDVSHCKRGRIDQFLSSNPILTQPLFWVGVGSMVVGELFQLCAYKFAPTTVITPLGALRVISTAILSRWYLQETMTKLQVYGIATCVAGSVLLVVSAPQREDAAAVRVILTSAGVWFYLIFSLMIVYSVVAGLRIWRLEGRQPPMSESNADEVRNQGQPIALLAILQTWALGTISVLSTKLLTMFTGKDISFANLVVLALLGTTLPAQLYYINLSLKYKQASEVMPLKYAGGNVLVMLCSVILFHESDFMNTLQMVGMVFGLAISIIGIYMVVYEDKRCTGST